MTESRLAFAFVHRGLLLFLLFDLGFSLYQKIRKINHPDEIDSERKNKSCTNHFPPSCESAPPPPTKSHHTSSEKSLGKKIPKFNSLQ